MSGISRLEELIEELETSPDDESSERVCRALETFLEVQRSAFGRVLEILRRDAPQIVDRLLEDPLVGSILRGYHLVQPDLQATVEAAFAELQLDDRVRLIGVQSGVARFEAVTDRAEWAEIKGQIERAVRAAAPQLVGVAVARSEPSRSAATAPRTLPVLGPSALSPPGAGAGAVSPGWLPLVHWWNLEAEGREKVRLFDRELVVFAVDGRAFAFENVCPAGGEALDTGTLEGLVLTCAGHGLSYDLVTGSCRERPEIALPLSRTRIEDGVVKVEASETRDVQ